MDATGSQVLDVRTAKEFQSGHLQNASQADWKNRPEFTERTKHLDKSKPVLVYCAAGSRSAEAADWLINNGFEVKTLDGGFKAWESEHRAIAPAGNEKPISLAEYKVMTNLGSVVLVDIGADWCPPCKKMDPLIKQLDTQQDPAFKLVKIDAGMQADLMKAVNAEKIPTFIIYKNGIESWRKEGIVSASELKQNLQ